ncbi:MAG: excisionase family DNA-binding protein, partial [Sciscionella sp.]
MDAPVVTRVVFPPKRPESLSAILSALGQDGLAPVLLTGDGTRIELPDELFTLLRDVVSSLSEGLAVTVAPQHTTLTTTEAAALLGVSRPTLVRLLEAGGIPYEQPSRHRKVRLTDVLAYQDRMRRARSVGLDEMVRESEAAGVYD